MEEMINFTVGPVMSDDIVKKIGSQNTPYFRTAEFSEIMLENEKLIKKFAKASADDKVVFITGSGTASMEAAIINTLTENDKALIINGGSFGERFVQICNIHHIPYDEIKMEMGHGLTKEILDKYDNKGYTTFIVNIHETSTGVHYDLDLIHDFCKKNKLFLIVDAISSFLADEIEFTHHGIDIMITGSQKALACPPGISLMVLSKKAQKRIYDKETCCLYLDLKEALKNGERGQTPWTPAVTILLQINARLKEIEVNGGAESERKRIKALADDFRNRIKNYPFEIVSDSMSNAVTPLHPLNVSAYDIFLTLKDEYGIWICPNGGELKDKVLRVGHIGALTISDNDKLFAALDDMKKRNLL